MATDHSLQALDTLRLASEWIAAGQHTRAREALSALVHADPRSADAHRLLALSMYQTGEIVRAQKELRACLRLRGDDLDVRLSLGRTLLASGQPDETLRILREVADRDPRNPAVACVRARALLAKGDAGAAQDALEVAARPFVPPSVEFWMLLGHARMANGRPRAAADAFREWLRIEPASIDARARLAAALADGDQPEQAEVEIRRCIAEGAGTAEAAFVLARALMGQRRNDEAEAELRNVVRMQPGHVTAQGNLSELVWMRTGDLEEAGAELTTALARQPRLHALRIVRARLLLNARKAREALSEIDRGLALDQHDIALLRAAATIALDLDGVRALAYAERAVRAAPEDRGSRVALGNASLAVGDARRALEIASTLRLAQPLDGQAVAMQADAQRMSGDPSYRTLLDYTHLVRADLIDVPPGWPDLQTYIADLQAALERSHTSTAHPIGNSLRHGSQIAMAPERSIEPAIRAFPLAIDGPIRRYMEAIGPGADPTRCRNSRRYRVSGIWSVRLRPTGFHVNHYHPQGWISSACYLHLPPAVATRHGEGWLKFGEPGFSTHPALGPEYFLKPSPGLLALFPSYMWHGTVPFAGADQDSRLTVAFDVVPIS